MSYDQYPLGILIEVVLFSAKTVSVINPALARR
jgi:hypothetical protein